jgi:hypothetical protein
MNLLFALLLSSIFQAGQIADQGSGKLCGIHAVSAESVAFSHVLASWGSLHIQFGCE